jgi:uncharacterized protein (TIGR03083 family)
MGLERQVALRGLIDEYGAFADLVRSLDQQQWRAPSRCEGWDAGDVARHVAGTATDVAAGQPGTHTPEEEVAERKGRSAVEVSDELVVAIAALEPLADVIDDAAWNGPSPLPDLTLRQGILTLLNDVYLHGDDIRSAAGLPPRRGVGLAGSVEFVAERLTADGWGPATLALDGLEKIDVGAGGDALTGDPLQFVLAATGRGDPLALGLDSTVNIYRQT